MKKKVVVVGPAFSQTGYGEHCRFTLRSLLSRDDIFDIYLRPTGWGKSSWLLPNDHDRGWLDMLVHKTVLHVQSGGTFDISLQVTIPNEWEKLAPINIGVTAGIETTRIAPQWVEKSRLMDRIVTISKHSRDVFLETEYDAVIGETGEKVKAKCETPVDIVHYPVRDYKPANIELDFKTDFNFLLISQWGPRKNFESTIKWWVEEFKDEEVGLIVKTNVMKTSILDRLHTKMRLDSLLTSYGDVKCKVYLLHGNMSDHELTSLYRHPKVKSLISLTHGEGFGLTLFEAAYNGLPIIAPDWSGHRDFLYAPKKIRKKGKKPTIKNTAHFAKVAYDIKNVQPEVVWDGVITADSSWCYARQHDFTKQCRNVIKNITRFEKQAENLKSWVLETFTSKNQYEKLCKAVMDSDPTLTDDGFDVDGWLSEIAQDIQEYE